MTTFTKGILVIGLCAASGVSGPPNQDKAEVALKAAMDKEVLDGNLKSAIEQYRKIAVDYRANRTVAAEALVHMGQCYEKLGDAEARSAYERVVREFGDQKEAADEARKHLSGKAPASGSAVAARLALKLDGGSVEDVSRDGRYAAVTNSKGIFLYDLVKGGERRIVGTRENGESFQSVLISPNGKQIAYTRTIPSGIELYLNSSDGSTPRRLETVKSGDRLWATAMSPDGGLLAYTKGTEKPLTREVHLVDADGKNSRVIVHGAEGEYCYNFSWSSDGSQVVVSFWSKERGYWLVLASVKDTATREIPMAGSGSISPDGKYIAFTRNRLWGKTLPKGLEDGILVTPIGGGKEVRLYPGSQGSTWDLYWMPDSKGLLFNTRRPQQYGSDQWDVYSLRFVDGTPGGRNWRQTAAPQLVKSDLTGGTMAYTPSGDYYYLVSSGPRNGPERDIFDAEIDPATGKRISEPKSIYFPSSLPHRLETWASVITGWTVPRIRCE